MTLLQHPMDRFLNLPTNNGHDGIRLGGFITPILGFGSPHPVVASTHGKRGLSARVLKVGSIPA